MIVLMNAKRIFNRIQHQFMITKKRKKSFLVFLGKWGEVFLNMINIFFKTYNKYYTYKLSFKIFPLETGRR